MSGYTGHFSLGCVCVSGAMIGAIMWCYLHARSLPRSMDIFCIPFFRGILFTHFFVAPVANGRDNILGFLVAWAV